MTVFKPDEHDNLVSRAERVANNVMERFDKVVGRLEQTVPRPMGAEKVPPEEEVNEYLLTIAQAPDPVQASSDLIAEWAQTYGIQKAQKMFVEYVDRNERHIRKIVDKG